MFGFPNEYRFFPELLDLRKEKKDMLRCIC